jgi:hypothetical protein
VRPSKLRLARAGKSVNIDLLAGGPVEATMRKVLTSLALGCALAAALSVAASACPYHEKQTSASAEQTEATAQAATASEHN